MKSHRLKFLALCLLAAFAAPGAASAARIVTVGGAITEIVYALGAEKQIVGNDTTSYFPPAAAKLPKVGYLRALSAEGVLSLSPDLLILNEDAGPPPVLKQLQAAGLRFLRLKAARSLDDVFQNIGAVAEALDRRAEGAALVDRLMTEAADVRQKADARTERKRVMFILSHGGRSPLVAGRGTSADRIIALAGAENVVQGYEGYKPLTPESAVDLAPEIILTTDQGLKHVGGKASFLSSPGLALTPAGKAQNLIAMDALLLLGFGPRTVAAAKTLNALVYGE